MNHKIIIVEQLKKILVAQREHVNGLSQAEMATRLNMNQTDYCALEADPSSVSLEQILRVFDLLGMNFLVATKESEHLTADYQFSPIILKKVDSQSKGRKRRAYSNLPPLDFTRKSATKW